VGIGFIFFVFDLVFIICGLRDLPTPKPLYIPVGSELGGLLITDMGNVGVNPPLGPGAVGVLIKGGDGGGPAAGGARGSGNGSDGGGEGATGGKDEGEPRERGEGKDKKGKAKSKKGPTRGTKGAKGGGGGAEGGPASDDSNRNAGEPASRPKRGFWMGRLVDYFRTKKASSTGTQGGYGGSNFRESVDRHGRHGREGRRGEVATANGGRPSVRHLGRGNRDGLVGEGPYVGNTLSGRVSNGAVLNTLIDHGRD